MKLWKRLTALCLSALVCVTLLTACGRKESTDGRASLSVCVGETPATYDPIYAQRIGDQTILNHLYENLMRLETGENGQTIAVPGAAKSVDMKENSDGTVTYTFRLRGGKWSDGVEVKASDFVYAWQRLADPATGSVYAPLLSIVCGYAEAQASGDMSLLAVSAKSSTTLVVTLTGHYDWFLREVCTSIATLPLRQDVVQRLKQEADAANDNVWPLTEEEMAEQMEADETWQAEPVLETYSVMFNCSRLEDESIRKALSLVIDREQLAAMAGITAQPAEGLVPPGVPEDNADLDFRACGGSLLDNDPESYADRCQDAVDLMQNAGYDRGSDLSAELGALEYLYVDQGSNKTVAMALCGMWGHYLGVNVTPRAVTPAELASAMRSGNYTLAGMSVSAVCSDAECFLMDWTTGNRDNFLHYENSAYDTLMSIIAGAEDGSARMGCLHDAEDLLLEIDCAISPLYTVGTAWKLRDTYLGAIRDPRGWFDFRGVYPKPVTVQ